MNAYIVKDNNFKTVGFEVFANGTRIFNFGISHESPFYFVKQVNTNDWMTDIIALIRLSEQIRAEESFTQYIFEAIGDSEHVHIDEGCGVNLSKNKARIEKLHERMMNIINNII